MQSSPPPPSQPAREPETGLRYMLAMRQLDCEIGQLRSPRLIDVAPGADVKPDILKWEVGSQRNLARRMATAGARQNPSSSSPRILAPGKSRISPKCAVQGGHAL